MQQPTHTTPHKHVHTCIARRTHTLFPTHTHTNTHTRLHTQISGFHDIKKVFSYNEDWKRWSPEDGFTDVKEPYFITDGVNMSDLLDCLEVDHTRTVCNDVLEVRVRVCPVCVLGSSGVRVVGCVLPCVGSK